MNSLFDRMAAHAARPKPVHRPLVDAMMLPDQFSEGIHSLTISVLEEEMALRRSFLGYPDKADADMYHELGAVLVEMNKDREPMSEVSRAKRAQLVDEFPFKDPVAREALRVSNETGELVRGLDTQVDERRAEILSSATGKNGQIDKEALATASRRIIAQEADRQIGEEETPRDARIMAATMKKLMALDDLSPAMVSSSVFLMDGAADREGRIGLRALGKIALETPDLLQTRVSEKRKSPSSRKAGAR